MRIRKTLRALHRDFGYFFVGLTLLYSISGIILVLKPNEKDPAFKELRVERSLPKNLSPDELKTEWAELQVEAELNRVIPANGNYRLFLKGGLGEYHPESGALTFTTYHERPIIKFINQVHYNTNKNFTWLGILYGAGLLFFALSGLFMLKGKKGFSRHGWWIMLAGLALPIVWYLIVI